MELERLTVNVRPRRPWEAADLGVRMVQRWWRELWLPYLSVLWGLALLGYLLVPSQYLMYAGYAIWWLKPLYDRLLLSVLARATFGEPPTPLQTLRGIPGLLRTGLFTALTLGRLDPQRAFHLPVWQLEGLRGRRRRTRRNVLGRRVGSHAVGLTLLFVNMELVLVFGLYGLLWMMLPEGVEVDFSHWFGWDGDNVGAVLLYLFFYLLAVSLVEPLYVASGFALYLNRRTQLEGWDLELAFRRLVNRLAPAVFLLLLIWIPGASPEAAESEPDFRAEIQEILAAEEFSEYIEIDNWDFGSNDEDVNDQQVDLGVLSDLGHLISIVAEVLLWGLVILAVYLLYRWRHTWWPALSGWSRPATKPEPAAIAMGELATPIRVEDELALAAEALWRQGKPREAMALLYRAAVEGLDRAGLPVARGATEGDVLDVARKGLGAPGFAYLRALTRHWRATAYAHRLPAEADFLTLCEHWPGYLSNLLNKGVG